MRWGPIREKNMKLANADPQSPKNDQTLVDPRLRTVNHWLFNLEVVFLGLEYKHGVPILSTG